MDDNSTGPLVRRDTITDNGINGVWVRPNPDGVVETTNAVDYGDNPLSLGGSQNYIFNADVPYVFTSLMDIGTEYLYDSSSTTTQAVKNRLYIQPGMLLKFEQGAGVQVVTAGASLNVGDQTYIRGFDSDASIDPTTGLETSTWGPGSPGFAPNDTTDANVVFTSALDNNAYTYYKDPLTGLKTTIVAANDALDSGGANQPTPGNVTLAERWGSITIDPGAIASINEAQFDYGGGQLNVPGGTTQRQVLYLLGMPGPPSSSPTRRPENSRSSRHLALARTSTSPTTASTTISTCPSRRIRMPSWPPTPKLRSLRATRSSMETSSAATPTTPSGFSLPAGCTPGVTTSATIRSGRAATSRTSSVARSFPRAVPPA